jgi:methionine sulfoxide reductase heme-binding subunit
MSTLILTRYPSIALNILGRNFRLLTHIIGLLPLTLLILDTIQGNLTANPIQYITLRTGKAALILLVLSLACTPLNIVFGLKQALSARRTLGLYTFLYAFGHATIFVAVDYFFDIELIVDTIREKRYLLAGMGAFLILLPLALTSFRWWMKRLGKNWKRLHRLVYLAALLAVTHYVWLVKSDIRVPLAYGAGILVLLAIRIPAVRSYLVRVRGRLAVRR